MKVRVEDLIAAKKIGHVPAAETSRWLTGLDDQLHERLHHAGLVTPRGKGLLGPFTRDYIDGRADIKPNTRINMERARAYLLECFDERKALRDFTEGDAEDFWQHMKRRGLAENTIRKAVGRIRQFFTAAQRRKLVDANPFKVLPAAVVPNHERFRFVERATIDRVLAHCPTWSGNSSSCSRATAACAAPRRSSRCAGRM